MKSTVIRFCYIFDVSPLVHWKLFMRLFRFISKLAQQIFPNDLRQNIWSNCYFKKSKTNHLVIVWAVSKKLLKTSKFSFFENLIKDWKLIFSVMLTSSQKIQGFYLLRAFFCEPSTWNLSKAHCKTIDKVQKSFVVFFFGKKIPTRVF